MTAKEALEIMLKAYRRYYDINEETPLEPFAAQAFFHSHESGYFLVKKAVTSEAESNEHVYFYTSEHITRQDVERLAGLSWEDGISKTVPHQFHRNTDVSLILIGESFDEDAFEAVKKLKFYKSYKFRFQGWSDFRCGALDLAKKAYSCNRRGSDYKKTFKTFLKNLQPREEKPDAARI